MEYKVIQRSFLLMIFGLTSLLVFSQTHQSVISPRLEERLIPDNPNISSLGKFGFQPINKYTGTANISIPLHVINLDGLSIPLVASYNTGGIRVSQEASWIGLGWSLGSGCFISNEVNGFDDTKSPVFPSGASNGQPSGYIYNKDYLTRNPPTYQLEITPDDVDELVVANQGGGQRDTEPDVFTANLFGKKVKFSLQKLNTGETTVNAKIIGSPSVKVVYHTDTGRFVVTDERGFIYEFDHVEYSTPYTSNKGTYYSAFTEEDHIRSIHHESWHLQDIEQDRISWQVSKIISPLGNELFFEYERTLNISYPSVSEQISFESNIVFGDRVAPQPYLSEMNQTPQHTARYYVFENVVLNRVYGDFGSIDFNLTEREDLFSETSFNDFADGSFSVLRIVPYSTESPKKLSSMLVKDQNGSTVKNIVFNQSYFNNNRLGDLNQERYVRLKLDGISINEKEYHFDYIEPNALPSKISKDMDFWGFYNGANNLHRIPKYGRFHASYTLQHIGYEYYASYENECTKKSDFNFGKIGLLNKVYYPTGGSTEYLYEGNTASVISPEPYDPVYDTSGNFKFSKMSDSEDYSWNYQYLKMANDPSYSFVNQTSGCTTSSQNVSNNQDFTITSTAACDLNYNVTVYADISCSTGCGMGINPSGPATWIRNLDTGSIQNIFNFEQLGTGQNSSISLSEELTLPPGNYRFEYDSAWSNTSPLVVATNNSSLYVHEQQITTPSGNALEEFEVGGARVQRVLEKDIDGTVIGDRAYSYNELKVDGTTKSSGILMNELVYHSKNNGFFEYTPEYYYGNSSNLHSHNILRTKNSASGSHLGYSTVTERILSSTASNVDNGQIVTTYTNEPNEPVTRFIGTTLVSTTQTWTTSYGHVYLNNAIPKSFGYKNGNLKSEQVFANDGTLKKSTSYEYKEFSGGSQISDAYPLISYQFFYLPTSCPVTICGFTSSIPYYKEMSSGDVNANRYSLLEKVTDTLYQPSGDIVTTTEYEYQRPALWTPTSVMTTNSEGEVMTQKRLYPQDLSSDPHVDELIAQNRLVDPIETQRFKGVAAAPEDKLLGEEKIYYENDATTNGLVLPKRVTIKKGQTLAEDRLSYEAYDFKGNPLEVKAEDGISTSYIWGYNGEYVLAKIENAKYSSFSSQVTAIKVASNADDDRTVDTYNNGTKNYIGKEGALRDLLDDLRTSLPGAMVTTYTYDPLIGVTSMTDPRGYTVYYDYDNDNRLKEVRDQDNNLVTDYDYKYVTATIQN